MRTRLIQAAFQAAVAEGRFDAPKARRAPARVRLYRDGRLTLLAPYFDYAYYAFENPDFDASGLDELEHFDFFGWRRLRNPAAWFDTGYYLASNPDVFGSGDNPFWHYVLKGRAEGRAARRPRGAERAILDALTPPEARAGAPPPAEPDRLSADALAARLAVRLAGAPGLVYRVEGSEPHADKAALMAAEARGFAELGYALLSGAPLRGGQMLKEMPAAWSETRLALDGETLGVVSDAALAKGLAKALAGLGDAAPADRALLVRGVLGASVDGLLALEEALAPQRRWFWLDDFGSLCTSPRLLRNDVAFCDAPPPESTACAICIHGEARRAHLAALARLFERGRFTVVAPSDGAAALWRRASALPHEGVVVAAPAVLEEPPAANGAAEVGEIGAEGRPVRVAFLGAPTLEGGWLTYLRLLEACGELVAYAFHHFAYAEDLRPSRNLFGVEATRALRDRLVERRIDIVVRPSEGPETFSLASVEALAAGCDLVTLGHSGHAAECVARERRGAAFATDDELLEFFVSGKAIAYARERDRFARHIQGVRLTAGSATLIG